MKHKFMAGVFISLFANNFEKRNFKIPDGDEMRHNPRNNKRTKSRRGKK